MMDGSMARAAAAYRQTQVQSRSPLELVAMLYDGALRFMHEARTAIESGDANAKREAISRSLAVVSELQNTLNLKDGGSIASSLDSLYTFVNGRLLEASMHGSIGPLDEAIRVMAPLKDAWEQVSGPAPNEALRV